MSLAGKVFRNNGHPPSFIHSTCREHACVECIHEKRGCDEGEDSEKKDPMVVVHNLYVAGFSEDIRRVCRRFGIMMVFWLSMTLRNQLTRVACVYHILCSCWKIYIGETIRRLEARMREHLQEGGDGEICHSGARLE